MYKGLRVWFNTWRSFVQIALKQTTQKISGGFFIDPEILKTRKQQEKICKKYMIRFQQNNIKNPLQNCSVGSRVKRNEKNNFNLSDLIISRLDDNLPDLEPHLQKYVRKFNIPDAELFLRIVKCPHIFALRDLAIQHLSPRPQESLQKVLGYFAPATQSQIEFMLKTALTDETIFEMSEDILPPARWRVMAKKLTS